ncbi:helix-turn-helix domain-containing protein [Vallitalea sediminicola]
MPKELFVTDTCYYHINQKPIEGIISCGFLTKNNEKRLHNFIYYGGFIVLSGKGKYIGEDGKVIELRPGYFVQRRPNVKHTTVVESTEPWLEFYICMGPSIYELLGEIGIINTVDPVFKIKPNHILVNQCTKLLTSFKEAKEKDVKKLFIKVQNLLMLINSLYEQLDILNEEDNCIDMLCDTLSHGFQRKIDLKEEAKKYNMSYEKLRKIFKQRIGVSPHKYLITKRINEAQSMLHNPNLTISEIADMLGFYDSYAFSNQFKKIVGVSPKKFRGQSN